MAKIDLREMGVSGAPSGAPDTTTMNFMGQTSDRYLPELQGPTGIKTMARVLRREPAAYITQRTMSLAARQAEWSVAAGEDTESDDPTVKYLKECMEDMSHSWRNMIQFAFSAGGFGFADIEIVLKRRMGAQTGALPSSKFDDELIGIRKLAPRRQETVTWKFDDNGGPLEMIQLDPVTGQPRQAIPIEKIIHFQSGDARGGWEGAGWLEPAYQLAHRISNYEMILSIGHQRAHVGLPVFAYKAGVPGADVRRATEAMARGLVVNTHQFVTYPEQIMDFKLATVSNNNAAELSGLISQLRWEIMSLGLVQFLRLGSTSSGSRALADPLKELFISSINAALDEIADALNRHLIPRLLAANPSLNHKGAQPKFVHNGVKNLPIEVLRYLGTISSWMNSADPVDEEWVRNITGLPSMSALSAETLKRKEEVKKKMHETIMNPPQPVAAGGFGKPAAKAAPTKTPVSKAKPSATSKPAAKTAAK